MNVIVPLNIGTAQLRQRFGNARIVFWCEVAGFAAPEPPMANLLRISQPLDSSVAPMGKRSPLHRADKFALLQNYPNPFNPSTVIRYSLNQASMVRLTIYDVLGREIRTLVDAIQDAGPKEITFDASSLPSGPYFYRLQAGKLLAVQKMMLVK